MVRVIANIGLRNSEFESLRNLDIDGTLLHVNRQRPVASPARVLPIRPRTYAALASLHHLNSESAFVLGDCPRTRVDYMIRKLKMVAPQLANTKLSSYSIRLNFECRLVSAGIPTDVARYMLGRREFLRSSLSDLIPTLEQRMQIARRSLERFVEEL